MAALTEAQVAHQHLLEKLDIHSVPKTFRSPSWKPNQRRNKNLKTIVGDASKREASALATPGSGAATPDTTTAATAAVAATNAALSTSGTATPAGAAAAPGPNLAQASSSLLSKLVLEKSLGRTGAGAAGAGAAAGAGVAPAVTYTNIESAPSLAHPKRYCDVTGLPAPYFDPKTRVRYHNKEIFALIRSLPQSTAELYLEARGAHTILK